MHNGCYIGRIESIKPIELADRLESATIYCGDGGTWEGVVEKGYWEKGETCVVFLQDAIVPPIPGLEFMDKSKRRVKMARFRGAPSECVIFDCIVTGNVGDEVSEQLGVTKYEKPIPVQMQGQIEGNFPSFIPKTDEPNYQAVPAVVGYLKTVPFYVTLKVDGTSGTAYRYHGKFGVCSRNWELKEGENIYWRMARKHDIETKIPEGYAIQFEVYGEGIQKNPLGIKGQDIIVFNLYNITKHEYEKYQTLKDFCSQHELPFPQEIDPPHSGDWRSFSETIKYSNGKPAEGIVIRPLEEHTIGNCRCSMKVLNLLYKE